MEPAVEQLGGRALPAEPLQRRQILGLGPPSEVAGSPALLAHALQRGGALVGFRAAKLLELYEARGCPNLVGKVLLVGFDFCCGEEEAIAAGIENATVAQFPTKMASLGVDALVRAIRGEKVESLIDSGAALVTKANMAEFK